MLLVTTDKMSKQVAGDLGISEIMVKIHRGAAMHKMGARTYAELVRIADVLKPNRRKLGRQPYPRQSTPPTIRTSRSHVLPSAFSAS